MASKIVGKEGTGTRAGKGATAIRVRNAMDQKIVFLYSLPNGRSRTAICVDSTECEPVRSLLTRAEYTAMLDNIHTRT